MVSETPGMTGWFPLKKKRLQMNNNCVPMAKNDVYNARGSKMLQKTSLCIPGGQVSTRPMEFGLNNPGEMGLPPRFLTILVKRIK